MSGFLQIKIYIYFHSNKFFFFFSGIDDCAFGFCFNNGTCIDGLDMYTCACVVGFTGLNCETGKYWYILNFEVRWLKSEERTLIINR